MSSFRNPPDAGKQGIWSIERVVTLLTPIFGIAAGLATGAVGKVLPGVNLNKGDLTALFIAGFGGAVGTAIKWLHGRQKFTQFVTDADSYADKVIEKIKANQLAGVALADIEKVLQAHTSQIIEGIGSKVGASPTAEEIAKRLVQELWPHSAVTPGGGGAAGAPIAAPGARQS